MCANGAYATSRQAGLSLIEVMVALVVGLILLAGVISIFISSRMGYSTNNAIAQLQENGRFALDFIRNDSRMTSYMGCTTAARTDTVLNPAGQAYNFLMPVYGFEYNGTNSATATSLAPYVITQENPTPVAIGGGNWSPTPDATINLPGGGPGSPIPGSDVLMLYTASGDPAYAIAPVTGGVIQVNATTGFQTGQLAVITDCLESTVFQISAVTAGAPGTITVGAGVPPPGNALTSFNIGFQSGAQVLTANVMAYYIGLGVDHSPALYKVAYQPGVGLGAPQELVPGVENLQVLYGVDSTGGSLLSPNQYLTAAQVDAGNDWANVLSVQVGLLLRSNTGAVPRPAAAPVFNLLGTYVQVPIDTRLRRVFTATIYLRNAPLPTS